MGKPVFLISGQSAALDYAGAYLVKWNYPVTDTPGKHVTHLLLPVPFFPAACAESVLSALSPDVTIMGGNLHDPIFDQYTCCDFLKDPWYLSENAAITAQGALQIALEKSPVTLRKCPVLVIGWGRIGKCLANLLKYMGADVTICTRDEGNRAILSCLGYDTADFQSVRHRLPHYRLIFNTAPAMVLSKDMLMNCAPDCIKIDLASICGMEGNDILWARGLPGKLFPESSGELIARTALRMAAG